MDNHHEEQFTVSGTNINEVKRKNADAGLSYNEVKELLAKNSGYGKTISNETNSHDVKVKNHF